MPLCIANTVPTTPHWKPCSTAAFLAKVAGTQWKVNRTAKAALAIAGKRKSRRTAGLLAKIIGTHIADAAAGVALAIAGKWIRRRAAGLLAKVVGTHITDAAAGAALAIAGDWMT